MARREKQLNSLFIKVENIEVEKSGCVKKRKLVLVSQTPNVLLVNLTPVYIHTIWKQGSLITESIHLVINQRHHLTAPFHQINLPHC